MRRASVQTNPDEAEELAADLRSRLKQGEPYWQAAPHLFKQALARREASQATQREVRLPGSAFWAAARAAALRPAIERCRREVFGAPIAPFGSWKAAVAWLFAQRTEGPNLADKAKARWWVQEYWAQRQWLDEVTNQMHTHVTKSTRGQRSPAGFSFRINIDRPILGDGPYWGQPLMQTKAGLSLLKHVSTLSRVTGWTQDDTIFLVLLGVTPREDFRFGIEFALPNEQGVLEEGELPRWLDKPDLWARVTTVAGLRPWHLHRQSFEAIGSRLRAALNESVGRGRMAQGEDLALRDQLLLDVVAMVGGLPPTSQGRGVSAGRKEYWQNLTSLWFSVAGRRVGRDALRMRWERLLRRHPDLHRRLAEILDTSPQAASRAGTAKRGSTRRTAP